MRGWWLLFLFGLAQIAWSAPPPGCDPEALAAMAEDVYLGPKLLVDLSQDPAYQKELSQTALTFQFTQRADSLPFFDDLARRIKTHRTPVDEKAARRLIDRAAADKHSDLPEAVKEQLASSLVLDARRLSKGGQFLSGDELQLLVKDHAAFDIGQLAARFVNEKLNDPTPNHAKTAEAAEEELVMLGLQAIADNFPGIPHPTHAKAFKKYMDDLKKKNRALWKVAVPQIHAVLLAMSRGEDVTQYRGKGIRGGLVEIALGNSVHRILVTHGEVGEPPVILNWGDVKASRTQQTKFIEEAIDRKRTVPSSK